LSDTIADAPGGALAGTLAEWEALEDVVGGRTLEILEQRRLAPAVHRRGWLVRRLLLTADLVGLAAAFAVAELIYAGRTSGSFGIGFETLLFAVTLPAWALIARLYGLYSQDDRRTNHVTADEVANVFNMVTVCTWLFFAITWMSGIAHPAIPKLLLFWALAVVIVPVARAGARTVARTRRSYIQNTVIVGAGDIGQSIAERLLRHPEYGVNLVGFVDNEPKERHHDLGDLTILGPPERLSAVIRAFDVERVIIAFSRGSHERILGLIRTLKDAFVQVDIVPRYFELVGPNTGMSAIEGVPVLCLPPRALGLSSRMLKRTLDLVVSILALLVLSPVLLLAALLIKIDTPGPVLFRQRRIGAASHEFSIIKLRTMVADADEKKEAFAHLNKHATGDARMFKIPNDPRLTRTGKLLRRLSLDELPQLLNVLRGEMSLVGPRPLIPSEDEHVEGWGRRRLDLKPGITGLWQVLGRSEIPFEDMVWLDYLYVTNWSLWHDLRLICGTVPAMLNGNRAL
jgi:exopolysaccharide biosynthesis polyprenyl glycosylphosphotransferase